MPHQNKLFYFKHLRRLRSSRPRNSNFLPVFAICRLHFVSEAQVKRLLEEQRKEYERKRQEEAFSNAQRKLKEVANTAAKLRKSQNEIIIAARRKLQEEAASLAAQRKLQEEAFITAQRKLQEEAATLAAQRKLQEEAFIAEQRKLLEEATKAATQRKLQEEALIAAQRKLQEEAAIAEQSKLQKEAARRTQQEEAAKRAFQEEATKKKQQEEAAKKTFQEEATKKKQQEEAAKRAFQEEATKKKQQEEADKKKQQEEAAKRAFQEEAAKKAFQEEATKKKQQEEAAKRAFQEEAAKKAFQEEATKKKQQEEAAKRAFQEKNAKKKQQEETDKKNQQEVANRASQEAAVTRPRVSPREADVLRYCSTCYRRSIMEMFECENGHGYCKGCKIIGRACGICRRNLTNHRSYDIENHTAQMKVPCPYAWQGCVVHIKKADLENHMQECPFKQQDCPLAAVFGNCRWSGKISELSSHFIDWHPNDLLTKLGSELHIRNIHRDCRYIRLVKLCYHFIFHLKISKHDGKVYMAVQLIGTKISAMKWLYEIHIYNKSENRRKYMYTDVCVTPAECCRFSGFRFDKN